MNRQPVVVPVFQPLGHLAKRGEVLFVDGFGVGCSGVDDGDDFGLAKRRVALGQVLQRAKQIRFVVAGDDDDQTQSGLRRGGDEPGFGGLTEVAFVRRNHVYTHFGCDLLALQCLNAP